MHFVQIMILHELITTYAVTESGMKTITPPPVFMGIRRKLARVTNT